MNDITKPTPISFWQRLKRKIFFWFGLTNGPVIKLYNGYGNEKKVFVFGHVLSLSPIPRKKFKKNILRNSYGLLRMFMVKPFINADIQLQWEGKTFTTKSEDDGFFKFEWEPENPLLPGWHSVQAQVNDVSGSAVTGEFKHITVFLN